MIFREKTYSVLLASSDEKVNSAVRSALPPGEYWPVLTAASSAEAKRAAAQRQFDLILINDPLPGDSALDLALQLGEEDNAIVALLVASDKAEDLYFRTVEQGIFTIPKPLPLQTFQQELRLLCAARERLAIAGKRQETVEERMAQIRLVNRAKWVLIEREGLTEPQAHRKIEKMAMDRRVSKETIAEEILAKNSD